MDALLIASGPDIAKVRDIQVKMIDLALTILYLMGTSIQRVLEGRILSEVFKEGLDLKKKTPVYREFVAKEESKDYKMSQEDEMKIIERLRRMGYVD